MKTTDIIDFFAYISELTDMYITAIEVKPMRIKENLYATGFRRKGLGVVEVHLKEIHKLQINSNGFTVDLPLKQDADGELWISAEMLSELVLRGIFNDIRNHFYAMKSFDVAELRYRLKTENKSDYIFHEETIVYESKTQACRETILKRKHCEQFKSKFHHFGNGNNAEVVKKVTDLEFAEAEMSE